MESGHAWGSTSGEPKGTPLPQFTQRRNTVMISYMARRAVQGRGLVVLRNTLVAGWDYGHSAAGVGFLELFEHRRCSFAGAALTDQFDRFQHIWFAAGLCSGASRAGLVPIIFRAGPALSTSTFSPIARSKQHARAQLHVYTGLNFVHDPSLCSSNHTFCCPSPQFRFPSACSPLSPL